jgi:2-phospho-L-lactate transferase/gluconeogenesis factor (CofD/UPF0052 family)/hydroxymethylpyrimidine pyrophosphatase-like HAD family hydrolase
MNIVILAGGTGSIALQTGLYYRLDSKIDGVDTKVIVNAYDNGLSTGAVRKVCDGKILGPSDVRKNQTTRLKLENPKSPWNAFLDIRFTSESSKAQDFCINAIDELAAALGLESTTAKMVLLKEAIETFFSIPVASKIDYTDFSLANIIYAGFARANKNSLREAARIMADLMGIKDNVILNDDRSMFLGAITKSGVRVTDEGDIVSWGNVDDPFVDVFFVDSQGNETVPVLCAEAHSAIVNADLIILSSGTQWSSLIPTYASAGFKRAVQSSGAKVVMVMNREPDKDSPGQTASDIVRQIVPRYFDEKRIHLVIDVGGHQQMSVIDKHAAALLKSFTTFKSTTDSSKHNTNDLFEAISRAYFSDFLDSEHFMFDYDDTLVGRGNHQKKSSEHNKRMLCHLKNRSSVSVCTGNSIKAVSLRVESNYDINTMMPRSTSKPLTIYADGGINEYSYDTMIQFDPNDDGVKPNLVRCINESYLIDSDTSNQIIKNLLQNGFQYSKIENRGGAMICIKPVNEEYRDICINLVKHILEKLHRPNLVVKPAGRTTIEINNYALSKQDAVKHVLKSGVKSITYVGDELESGNDWPVAQLNDDRVKCLKVKDPAETAFFLTTLLTQ